MSGSDNGLGCGGEMVAANDSASRRARDDRGVLSQKKFRRSSSEGARFDQARGIRIEQDERSRRPTHHSRNRQLRFGTNQRVADGIRLRTPERDEHNSVGVCEHTHRQSHPPAGRLRRVFDDGDEVSVVRRNRMAWEQRCDVPIWTHTQQDEVETRWSACDSLQFRGVHRRCPDSIWIVRWHSMDPFGGDLRGFEPKRPSEPIVRFGVVRRNRSFIRPKKFGP